MHTWQGFSAIFTRSGYFRLIRGGVRRPRAWLSFDVIFDVILCQPFFRRLNRWKPNRTFLARKCSYSCVKLIKLGPVFVKHYAPNICLPLNMPKVAKCCKSTIRFGLCSKFNQVIYSSSPISWQTPSSNTFREILLTIRLKCPNLQRAITPKNLKYFKKVNQVIYSSSPIGWPRFKSLAQIVFEISCWQV